MRVTPWHIALMTAFSYFEGAISLSPLLHSGRAFIHQDSRNTILLLESRTRSRIALSLSSTEGDDAKEPSLPALFPVLSEPLNALNFLTPTPIQSAAAKRSLDDENLLLIAPTGSGKTLAYLLPALTKALTEDGTVLVVAPTRELAVQLMRDTLSLLSVLSDDAEAAVRLAVRGVDMPTSAELNSATILIGTPVELVTTLKNMNGGKEFLAGDTLSAVILDEADVLLPLPPKKLRTALDKDKDKKDKKLNDFNAAQNERRKREQKRKLMAAKRKGTEITDDKDVVTPTEKLLGLVASYRFNGGENAKPAQILAGSATASRKTLDRLNRAMRIAASDASSTFDLVWAKDIKACRPDVAEGNAGQQEGEDHTIRAVTVPSQVKHQYIPLTKEAASSSSAVLSAVAKAATAMKPKTALVFLCGEFGKSNIKEKTQKRAAPKGGTAQARRTSRMKQTRKATEAETKKPKSSTETLSARKACSTLGTYGIEAQPLHVALGLEMNAKDNDEVEIPPFLVTFEGSARGLHFEGVDAVFIVGRPASAASYLHLAGRVGRASSSDGNVVIRPGTVVSLCTKGSATELEKWTKQVGGTALEELVL